MVWGGRRPGEGVRSYTGSVTSPIPDPVPDRFGLPRGSLVPGADIWDDVDEADEADLVGDADDVDDVRWMAEAQVVVNDRPLTGSLLDDDALAVEAVAAPSGLDDDLTYDGRSDEALASRLSRWGRTSMVGAGLSAIGFGLQKVLDPKEPIQIEIEVDGDADDDMRDPVKVTLDRDHPDQSVARLRPWLIGKSRTPEE